MKKSRQTFFFMLAIWSAATIRPLYANVHSNKSATKELNVFAEELLELLDNYCDLVSKKCDSIPKNVSLPLTLPTILLKQVCSNNSASTREFDHHVKQSNNSVFEEFISTTTNTPFSTVPSTTTHVTCPACDCRCPTMSSTTITTKIPECVTATTLSPSMKTTTVSPLTTLGATNFLNEAVQQNMKQTEAVNSYVKDVMKDSLKNTGANPLLQQSGVMPAQNNLISGQAQPFGSPMFGAQLLRPPVGISPGFQQMVPHVQTIPQQSPFLNYLG